VADHPATDDPAGADERRWRAQRQRAVAEHGAALDRQRALELARARELVAGFARQAREDGLRTVPLRARAYDGRRSYRTGLRGWYLRPDRSVAVGADGEFYLLTVPASLLARLTGADVRPAEPRLVLGEGARDGESIPLGKLLRQRLDAGDAWPA
jgi:hypothetical protein